MGARALVPYRKAVLQASPIPSSMCIRTIMSHITLAQSRMHQIPTREIEIELVLDSMDKYIARRQLRWLGHISRMPFDRLPRQLLSSWLPYKKPRVAPEMTFGKTMIKALKTFDTMIRSAGLQWLPIVPIGAIGDQQMIYLYTSLLRRVNT